MLQFTPEVFLGGIMLQFIPESFPSEGFLVW